MAKARAITKRRKAVRNIKKITQTMQLVATARYQKCLQRAIATKPYTAKLTEMMQTLAGLATAEHPLLRPNEGATDSILLTITSNRGLCGSYNAAVQRKAIDVFRERTGTGANTALEVVGKKGISYFRFLGLEMAERVTDVEDKIEFVRVAAMAERYMRLYEAGKIARVDVAFTRYISVSQQRPEVLQLLPIAPPKSAGAAARPRVEFEFSPPPAQLLARLIPESVKVRLFQCFNDAIVSEQVSRMVAMKSATDAAGDMIKSLTRSYNRARQSQITLELADIVGGAEAVK